MDKKNTQLTVRLPDTLLDHLRELAKEDSRSLNSYIALALEKHVATKRKK